MRGYVAQSNTTGEIIWHGVCKDDKEAMLQAGEALKDVTNWSLYHTRPVKQAVVHEYELIHTQEIQLELPFGHVIGYALDVDGEMETVVGSPSTALNEFNRRKNEAEMSCALYVSVIDRDGESLLKPLIGVIRDEDLNWHINTGINNPNLMSELMTAEIELRKKHVDISQKIKGGLING